MNTLRSYISESLLDIDNVDSTDALIEGFLGKNYKINGSYTIKNGVVDVKGNVEVMNKKITHLTDGLFRFGKVEGHFICYKCTSLKTLEGAPERVGGDFNCSESILLKTLEGAPKEVKGSFYCSFCDSLETFRGAPEKVGKDFKCSGSILLKTLNGAPKEVGGHFYCNDCNKKFTKEEVKAICKVNKDIIV